MTATWRGKLAAGRSQRDSGASPLQRLIRQLLILPRSVLDVRIESVCHAIQTC